MKIQKFLIVCFIFNTIAIIGSEDSSYEYKSSEYDESLEKSSPKQKKRTINAQNEKSFKKNKSNSNDNEVSDFIETASLQTTSSILKKDAIWDLDENNQGQGYDCNGDFYLYNSPHSDIREQAVYILNEFCAIHDPNHVSFINQNNRNLVPIKKESTAINTAFQRNIIFFAVKNHRSNNTSSNDNQVIKKVSSENEHIKKEDIAELCNVLRQHNSSAPLDTLITISFNKYKDLNPK